MDFKVDAIDTIGNVENCIKQARYLAQEINESYFDAIQAAYERGDVRRGNQIAQVDSERWGTLCGLLCEVLAQARDMITAFDAEHKAGRTKAE